MKKHGWCGVTPLQVQAEKKSTRTGKKLENSDSWRKFQHFSTILARDFTFYFFRKHDFVASVIPKYTFSKIKNLKNLISPCPTDTKIGNFTKIKNVINGFSL